MEPSDFIHPEDAAALRQMEGRHTLGKEMANTSKQYE